MDFKRMIVPAVGAGLVSGILSSIPLVSMGCCLWMTLGGFGAAYLYGKSTKIEMTEAAMAGGASGVVCGIVSGILGLILSFALNALGMGAGMLGGGGLGQAGLGMGVGIAATIVSAVVGLILAVIFGALGGVIYAATMGKK
jgi:hypothetical protein